MPRLSEAAWLLALTLLATVPQAHADDADGNSPPNARAPLTPDNPTLVPRSYLEHRDRQLAILGQTKLTVDGKLRDATLAREAHSAESAKILRLRLLANSHSATLPRARLQAFARWQLGRDQTEVALLADESENLGRATTLLKQPPPPSEPLGSVILPASGTIARAFGPYKHDYSGATLFRRGIDIAVASKTDVQSPSAGDVVYAGPIRGLGNGVIVQGPTATFVVAKLGTIAVKVGAQLAVGDFVGKSERARVYFEVRQQTPQGGFPIDPVAVVTRKQD